MLKFFRINIEYETILLSRIDKFLNRKKYDRQLLIIEMLKENKNKYINK